MEKVRVGVIGCGGRGHAHGLGYSQSPRAELVACADCHLPAAEGMAERFGFARAYADYREMLEKERLDVVSMCLWPGLHCPVVLDCVQASTPPRLINAEKPMAPTFGEAVRMHEACTAAGIALTFSHQRRFGRSFRLGRDLIEEGEIGDLQRMEMNCSNLFDWGTHWFDMMLFYNQDIEPDWLMGQIDLADDQLVFGTRVETAGLAYVKWPNNVTGLLTTGAGTAAPAQIRVIGSQGMLDVDHGKVRLLKAGSDWQTVPPRLEPVPGDDTTRYLVDAIDCLFEDRTSILCSANALRATQLIFASYESARARKRVVLPLKTEDSALVTMIQRGERTIPAWPAFLTDEEKAEGFELLFNGKDLAGWTCGGMPWSTEHGVLFGGHAGPGCLRSERRLGDFHLVFECRVDNRAEASLFLRAQEKDGRLAGLEISLDEDRTDPLGTNSPCGVRGVAPPSQHPRFGSSRWFWIEAICEGDRLRVVFDDHDLLDIRLGDYPELSDRPTEGFLAFQARQGWIDLRNVMARPIR